MLPLVLAGIGLVGSAIATSLDKDTQIERKLGKAFDPGSGLSPSNRKELYDKAMEIDTNRYKGESFADVDREEIDFNKWVEKQQKAQPQQREQAIKQYANNIRLNLKSQLDANKIDIYEYKRQLGQVKNWQREMEKM